MKKQVLFVLTFLLLVLALTLSSAYSYSYSNYQQGLRIAYPPHSYEAGIYPYYNSYTRYERADRNYFAPVYTVYRPFYHYTPIRKVSYISYSPRYSSIYLDYPASFGYKRTISDDGRPLYTPY